MAEPQTTSHDPVAARPLEPPVGLAPNLAAATFWRSAIWCMACAFSGRQCDMTSSHVTRNEAGLIDRVVLHMNFREVCLSDFAEYLQNHLSSLDPQKSPISIIIGLDNGKSGVLSITNSQICVNPELSLHELPNSEIMSYGQTSHERRVLSSWDERVWCYVSTILESNH